MLKNPRHEQVAQGLASGMTADAAYAAAGYKPDRGNAARLTANDSITKRVAELRRKAEAKFDLSRLSWLTRLLENADAAKEAGDLTAERQALREIALSMPGWYCSTKAELAVTPMPTPSSAHLLENPATQEAIARALMKSPESRKRIMALLGGADAA